MEDNYFASVGGIVLRNCEVLLVRHTYGGAAGKLLNPSGHIQKGELPETALARELFEETGVSARVIGMLALRCSQKDWWLVFLAEHVSGEPRSDGIENSEALYMPAEEALTHPDVTDATKELIRLALSGKPLMHKNAAYSAIASSMGRIMYS